MDEMALGRPPRHARKKKRSEPRKVAAPAVGSHEVACSKDCGRKVEVVVPASGPLRSIAEKQAAGGLPVYCEPCLEADSAAEEAAERAERERVQLAERRRVAGLPPKWASQTFDSLDEDGPRARAFELARGWAGGDVAGLVLWGGVGKGKTAIAAAAANARLRIGYVRWLPVSELLLDLRMPFESPEYARAQRALDAARGKAALVLDDLDKLKPSEHAVQPLYVAVNGWIEAELPLLVTLNRNLDALASWMPDTFGDAIASRLAGYCKVREVAGRDRRIEP